MYFSESPTSGSAEKFYSCLERQAVDSLLYKVMLAKGIDLPNADTALPKRELAELKEKK